jgi:cyclin A
VPACLPACPQLKRRPTTTYMESVQSDINPMMRSILLDWLVEVGQEYRLTSDTLFLSAAYIDRFLSLVDVKRNRLQLVGVTAMLVASKYEEIYAPQVEEFCYITDNTYTREQVRRRRLPRRLLPCRACQGNRRLAGPERWRHQPPTGHLRAPPPQVLDMERELLRVLDFDLTQPTIKTFLRRYIKAASGACRSLLLPLATAARRCRLRGPPPPHPPACACCLGPALFAEAAQLVPCCSWLAHRLCSLEFSIIYFDGQKSTQ